MESGKEDVFRSESDEAWVLKSLAYLGRGWEGVVWGSGGAGGRGGGVGGLQTTGVSNAL